MLLCLIYFIEKKGLKWRNHKPCFCLMPGFLLTFLSAVKTFIRKVEWGWSKTNDASYLKTDLEQKYVWLANIN